MINLIALGQVGSTIITSANTRTGNYCGFICLEASTFSDIKGSIDGETYVGVTFPAGMYVPIPFSSMTVATGKVLAIKSSSF